MKPSIILLPKISAPALTTALFLVSLSSAQAAICPNPKNSTEQVICNDLSLKVLDDLTSKLYLEKRATLSPMEQQEIERDQRLWRSYLKNCTTDVNCLRDAFDQRLTEIQDFDKVIEQKDDEDEGVDENENESENESKNESESESEDESNDESEGTPESKDTDTDSKNEAAEDKDKPAEDEPAEDTPSTDTTDDDNAGDTNDDTNDNKDEKNKDEKDDSSDDSADQPKSKKQSWLDYFSNWMFAKKEPVTSPKKDKLSSKPTEQKNASYTVLKSDLESNINKEDTKTPALKDQLVSEETGEVSDFEAEKLSADEGAELVKDTPTNTSDSQSDIASQRDQAMPSSKDSTDPAETTIAQTPASEEEKPEELSFFGKILSFFYSPDTSTDVATTPKTPINPTEPDIETAQTDLDVSEDASAEKLDDLAREIDNQNLVKDTDQKNAQKIKGTDTETGTDHTFSNEGNGTTVPTPQGSNPSLKPDTTRKKVTQAKRETNTSKPISIQQADQQKARNNTAQQAIAPSKSAETKQPSFLDKITGLFSSAPKPADTPKTATNNNRQPQNDQAQPTDQADIIQPTATGRLAGSTKTEQPRPIPLDIPSSTPEVSTQKQVTTAPSSPMKQAAAPKTEATPKQDVAQAEPKPKTSGAPAASEQKQPSLFQKITGLFSSGSKEAAPTQVELAKTPTTQVATAKKSSDMAQLADDTTSGGLADSTRSVTQPDDTQINDSDESEVMASNQQDSPAFSPKTSTPKASTATARRKINHKPRKAQNRRAKRKVRTKKVRRKSAVRRKSHRRSIARARKPQSRRAHLRSGKKTRKRAHTRKRHHGALKITSRSKNKKRTVVHHKPRHERKARPTTNQRRASYKKPIPKHRASRHAKVKKFTAHKRAKQHDFTAKQNQMPLRSRRSAIHQTKPARAMRNRAIISNKRSPRRKTARTRYARPTVMRERRQVLQTHCARCDPCQDCKKTFRLQHHLREYY